MAGTGANPARATDQIKPMLPRALASTPLASRRSGSCCSLARRISVYSRKGMIVSGVKPKITRFSDSPRRITSRYSSQYSRPNTPMTSIEVKKIFGPSSIPNGMRQAATSAAAKTVRNLARFRPAKAAAGVIRRNSRSDRKSCLSGLVMGIRILIVPHFTFGKRFNLWTAWTTISQALIPRGFL
jgi:hypothetical protein